MRFEDCVAGGELLVPVCNKCGAVSWPPTGRCSSCLGTTSPERRDLEVTVVARSKRDGAHFCLARVVVGDAGSFGVVASSRKEMRAGGRARITGCGMRGGRPYFEVG